MIWRSLRSGARRSLQIGMMGVWMMWWRRCIRGICFEEISVGEPRCRCGGGVILDGDAVM